MSEDAKFEEEEFSSQFNGDTVARLVGLLKPHWRWVVGFLICIGAVAIMESYFTFLNKRIIDEGILGGLEGELMALYRQVVGFQVPQNLTIRGNPDALRGILVQYAGLQFASALCVFGFIYLTDILGHRVQYDLRKRMFSHLQTLSFSYFDRTPVGWIMSRLTSDAGRISDLITWGMLDIAWAVLNVGTAIVFMLTINWQLTLLVVPFIPLLLYVAIWFKKKILVEFRQARKFNSKITGAYNENITGVRVVKALRREEKNLDEFKDLTRDMYRVSFRASWLSALFLPVVQIVSAGAIGGVLWYSGANVGTIGGLTIGGVQAFISYITFMMWPIQDIARVYAQMQQSVASAERIFSLLDAKPDIVDRDGATDPGTIRGEVVFENVDFFYEENKPVLKNFNLCVKPGETIALVGPTGHGKSTIVNLVCRFYEPKAGQITINGQDYTTMPMHAIHSRIGMVLQTPHLFSGTIKDNIRYGRLDASDDEVIEAAKLAGAHNFIMELEKGYEEEVGESGVMLSVGQKQLVSLARAILSDPEIMIMDEATSSVDTLTEALIQQGMENLMRDRTSFVIAHRLSTIKRADRIIVIEHGTIAEMGSHTELLRKKGHYYNLYTNQFRAELEKKYETGTFKAVKPVEGKDSAESIPA